MPAILPSIGVSITLPKLMDDTSDSKITIAYPMLIAEIRKSNGKNPVCQRGDSLFPEIIISVPSEDWCMVGSRTPSPMKKNMTLFSVFLRPLASNHAASVGENSIHSMNM